MIDILDTPDEYKENDDDQVTDYNDLLKYLDDDNEWCTSVCLA